MDEPISATSSITSTSNTLTCVPAMVNLHLPDGGMTPDMLSFLHALESNNRHTFLKPHASIPAASLQLAKTTLDAFAPTVSDEQQRVLRELNKKRKRKDDQFVRPDVLKIRKLHVEGFQTPQVWQQARRVISSTLDYSKSALDELAAQNGFERDDEPTPDADRSSLPNGAKHVKFGDDGFEISSSEGDEEEEDDEEDGDDDESGILELENSDLEEDGFEGFSGSEGDGIEEASASTSDEESQEDDEEPAEEFVEDPDGLNDGFFSIDEFNKQTQWFEDQDARADPNTDLGDEDEEEEVDWHADPFAKRKSAGKSKSTKKTESKNKNDRLGPDEESEEEPDADDDAGPTFGDMDLDAPEGDSEEEEVAETDPNDIGAAVMGGIDLTANDLFYKDFFAPPPKKGSTNKNGKSKKQMKERTPDFSEADMDRGIANTKRDLFDDLSERSEDEYSEDGLSEVANGDPKARRTKQERWQAKILSEITKLEAAAVAKRDWTLMGEANASERPSNSLLGADLDWEFAGRPAPVSTEETTADIAEIVKRRIIARDFDEITRRRPETMDAGTRRGLLTAGVDLANKERKGLAEEYEEEWQKQNSEAYMSKADEKLKKEEQEVERMWKEVSAKLDSLSSWHYKPRPVEAGIQVVSDIAAVSMEDAQPATAQGVSGGESRLAPQEVYKSGKETAEAGEVVGKSGLPVARQEMSREEKASRRRRQKERIRKAGSAVNGANGVAVNGAEKGRKATEKETIAALRKGGVKVINRKGEIVDVDGNKPKAEVKATGASFKL